MARSGLYKTEVEKARNTLLAKGKNPSIDAVRVALGNTGSKSTIHKYLKELETEDAAGIGGKYPIGEMLTDLVSRLAGQLNAEADAKVADARGQFEAQLRERTEQLEQARQEAMAFRGQLERLEIALHEEKTGHASARQSLAEATTQIRQLEERIAGLDTRVAEHETHTRSLEEKHRHAREALDHFRASMKEQRDQEQRRHEHQVQELQFALRQANEALTEKNHALLQLNRDNGRLTEQAGLLDVDLRDMRSALRDRDRDIQALQPFAKDYPVLQERCAHAEQRAEVLAFELVTARTEAAQEREARQRADSLAERVSSRSATLDEILTKLTTAGGSIGGHNASTTSPSATPTK